MLHLLSNVLLLLSTTWCLYFTQSSFCLCDALDMNYFLASFRNVSDYRAYLARLKSIPAQLAQVTDLMREGIAQKMLPPAVWCLSGWSRKRGCSFV